MVLKERVAIEAYGEFRVGSVPLNENFTECWVAWVVPLMGFLKKFSRAKNFEINSSEKMYMSLWDPSFWEKLSLARSVF